MKLLGIITAGPVCSVAATDGARIATREGREARAHADTVLPMVAATLEECGLELASLDGVAFGRGPGPFTGVRIAASVAQGLALAADLRVAPVSDLAVLAQRAVDAGHATVLAAVDARMGQVYVGTFRSGPNGIARPVAPEALCAPEDVIFPDTPCFGVGSGFEAYPALCDDKRVTGHDAGARARAVELLKLAAHPEQSFFAPEQALPVYLRDNVASPR